MPIRPEFRHHYGTEWIETTRPRILERARQRCERCAKLKSATVETTTGKTLTAAGWEYLMFYRPEKCPTWIDQRGFHHWALPLLTIATCRAGDGRLIVVERPMPAPRPLHVVLSIAHLDHNPANMQDSNLAALCQWCHLQHDLGHHRESRLDRKDHNRPLFRLLRTEAPLDPVRKIQPIRP